MSVRPVTMKHIIVSRINMPRELDVTHHKNPAPYKIPEWNAERVYLLNHILRPSLAQQTNQDFIFISLWGEVFEGNELENEIKEKVVRGLDEWDEKAFDFEKWKRGTTVKEEMDFAKQVKNIVSKYRGTEDYVLVTNIDCDDALHKDFVDVLQRGALKHSRKAPFYVDVWKRYALNLFDGRQGNKTRKNTPSPMISVVEKELECFPLKYHHPMLKKYIRGTKIVGTEAVQTINNGNILSGGIGEKAEFNLTDFSPKLPEVLEHYTNIKRINSLNGHI